jgi:hypothetical protein
MKTEFPELTKELKRLKALESVCEIHSSGIALIEELELILSTQEKQPERQTKLK